MEEIEGYKHKGDLLFTSKEGLELSALCGNVYSVRDLLKAKHMIDLLIELDEEDFDDAA